jgi:transcriptional regulator of acetoin/glycerol metabolism
MPITPAGATSRGGVREGARDGSGPRAAGQDEEHVNAIVQSHERCAALGVSRIDEPDFARIARADLNVTLERNRRLHDHAAPVMGMLHDQIARTESMVLLTDATGTIIHSIGDDDFLERARKVALKPGANWSETEKGTNAIGTALVDEVPTIVHADEHFLHANQFLTCSAAPILDPRGNMLGVLDVSGDFRSFQKHTLALVRMSARMIENRWLTEDFGHALRLHFHTRAEFIGTLMEGILAIREDGRIVGANRGALEQLGMNGASVRMHTLQTLFDTTLENVADHARAQVALPLTLTLGNGRQFAAFVRSNWLAWSGLKAAQPQGHPPSAAPTQPAEAASSKAAVAAVTRAAEAAASGSALARLRTGAPQIEAVLDKIHRVLDRDIPILILGETGTGKEMLARAIHADSARCRQPFVAVNCASIPETLIEAELFGYDEGAFTGARRKGAPGRILQANGGTLFLDEIGDMPLALQAHLLRVLQERLVTPLGSTRSVPVDLTIICATHRNLREMIDRHAFREDLYYRLNGMAVRLPPLRERSDLLVLARRILDEQSGPQHHQLRADVLPLLQRYGWPGNVRQLFQVLRTACVMAGPDRSISCDHLPDDFLEEARRCVAHIDEPKTVQAPVENQAQAAAVAPTSPVAQPVPAQPLLAPGEATAIAPQSAATTPAPGVDTAGRTLGDIEVELIRRTLEAAGGNISVASKRLGISRNTIYRKLRWNQPG